MMMENEGGLVVRGRVEIDMRQPFRSVKEAISLFGEKVLAGEIYANKLKEMQTNEEATRVATELTGKKQDGWFGTADDHEETAETNKQSTEKTKEEGSNNNLMAYYLNSLKQELEQTKKELQQLKSRETDQNQKPPPQIDPEIEELKFVENTTTTTKVEVKTQTDDVDDEGKDQEEDEHSELQKKRSVKFASPPLLTKVIVSKDMASSVGIGRGRHHHHHRDQGEGGSSCSPYLEKKTKRKPLIPLIMGALFSKKKGAQKSGSTMA